MPKVSHIELKISGVKKEYPIYYSKEKNFEIRGLRKEIGQMTGVDYCYYETERHLTEAIEDAVRKYHELISKEKKVIAYRIVLPPVFSSNKVGRSDYVGVNPMIPEKLQRKIGHFGFDNNRLANSFGFILEYEVVLEIEDDGKKHFLIDDDGSRGRYKTMHLSSVFMDWTEHRERFFKNLEQSTESMVAKMLAFFGAADDVLIPLIEAGGGTKLLR